MLVKSPRKRAKKKLAYITENTCFTKLQQRISPLNLFIYEPLLRVVCWEISCYLFVESDARCTPAAWVWTIGCVCILERLLDARGTCGMCSERPVEHTLKRMQIRSRFTAAATQRWRWLCVAGRHEVMLPFGSAGNPRRFLETSITRHTKRLDSQHRNTTFTDILCLLPSKKTLKSHFNTRVCLRACFHFFLKRLSHWLRRESTLCRSPKTSTSRNYSCCSAFNRN